MKKNGPGFFTLTALVKYRRIKFIRDSGSTVTLLPKSQFYRTTPLKPVETENRDVNDNRFRFEGKTIATVEINGKRNDIESLVATKKTNTLLGLDRMEKLGKTLDTGKTDPQISHIAEDQNIKTPESKVKKLFNFVP